MSSLVRIRAERDRMSAIDRRIADFLLDNAHLLRDYSSPQLADALGVSQSSVVKFSQRLGFKGYPDLKYAVSAAVLSWPFCLRACPSCVAASGPISAPAMKSKVSATSVNGRRNGNGMAFARR